ncbi:unnamed protein product [Didymodactylos carnosus]|nr:unnamed protein product [Didymodactylos carnosus]CAF4385776.1 unnamed protein product [Didymodactylos carnosus]
MSLWRFKVLTLEIVEKWSKSYERGLKQFSKKQTVTLDLWTNAYQWTTSNRSILWPELDDTIEYYYSFDQYKIKAFNVWCVTLPVDKLRWLNGLCDCPVFFKKFMCKHVVGMAIRLNYCRPPPAAKDIPPDEKRRRGRPSKAKKALLIQ